VVDRRGFLPVVSPDGKSIAYTYVDPKVTPPRGLAIMAFDGAPPTKLFDIPAGALHWSPDGRHLLYVNNVGDVWNLWSQPIAGGPPKQITHFSQYSIYGFDLSERQADDKDLSIDSKKRIMLFSAKIAHSGILL
jgi:Tol biopolymer transport system component